MTAPSGDRFPYLAVRALEHLEGTPEVQWDAAAVLADLVQASSPQEAMCDMLARYRELKTSDPMTSVYLNDESLVEGITRPLRSAKLCYTIGEYLACIALCGVIGEMCAILLHDVKIAPKDRNPKNCHGRFVGKKQHDRICALEASGLPAEYASTLKKIAGTRNEYLHSFIASRDGLREDAKQLYRAACAVAGPLVTVGIGRTPRGTVGLVIDPDEVAYLRRRTATKP